MWQSDTQHRLFLHEEQIQVCSVNIRELFFESALERQCPAGAVVENGVKLIERPDDG